MAGSRLVQNLVGRSCSTPAPLLANPLLDRSWYGSAPRTKKGRRRLLATIGILTFLGIASGHVALAAPSGLAVAPQGDAFLVNKDIGGERWTIVASVSPSGEVVGVAGLVRTASGDAGKFVSCALRPDSECRRLDAAADPSCELRLQCDGADACDGFAIDCAKTWKPLVDDLGLPVSFFVRAAGTAAVRPSAVAPAAPQVARPAGGSGGAGATVTPRFDTFLSSKPFGAQRWSVALQIDTATKRAVATGNVFNTDDTPPQFVYCTSAEGQNVPLFLASRLPISFDCLGANRCETDTAGCRSQWTSIASAPVPTSLFLPDAGLQSASSIDLESCFFKQPPCIQIDAGGGSSTTDARVSQQTCAVGGACSVVLSSCGSQPGQLVQRSDGRCACEVSVAPASCRPCTVAGEACAFSAQTVQGCIGGSCSSESASGVCQVVASSGELLCSDPSDASGQLCGSTIGGCGGGTCCVDDARDGCLQSGGDVNCGGICVPGSSGPACLGPEQLCPNSRVDAGEQCDSRNLGGASCESLGLGGGSLACSRSCRFDTRGCNGGGCGDGVIGSGEECDGDDLGGASCQSLGLGTGTLRCSGCERDTSGCRSCGDGIINGDDSCDGTNLQGQTCQSLGFSSGTLRCSSFCDFDTSSCQDGPSCGNGIVEGSENCDPPGVISFDPFSSRCDRNGDAPNLIDVCCPGKCRSTTPATCTAASSPEDVPQSTISFACQFVD